MNTRAKAASAVACLLAAVSVLVLPGRQAASWGPTFSPRLLEPSGTHDVGVRRTRLDTGADDPWNPGHTRVLMVDVHYPAAAGDDPLGHYARAQYMTELGMLAWSPDHERRLDLGEDDVNWLFRTHSHEWAPPHRGRFPVLVISAPFAGVRTSFTTLAEDLASHGSIAVTVDHPYEAPAVELWPTRQVVEADDAERRLPASAATTARTADVRAVADRLRDLDREIADVMAPGCVVVVSGDLRDRATALTDDPLIEAQISTRHPQAARAFRTGSDDFRAALAARLAEDPACRTTPRSDP